MNAWYLNGENLLNGQQSFTYFLVPYRYSFFLFVFPETWLFNQLASHLPNFTLPISSLDPRLNPGAQWGISVVPGLLYDFLLKLPLIVSDSIVALLVFRISKQIFPDKNSAVLAAAFWFLNPLVIWVSSGWGMFDTIPTLFTVLALYFLFKEKFSFASLMIVLSTLMKFYAVVLFVPLFILIWRQKGVRGLFYPLVTAIVSAAFSAIPLFFISNPLSYISASTPSAAFQYAGLSIWTFFSAVFSTPNLSIVSDVLVVSSLLGVYYFVFQNRANTENQTTVAYFLLPLIALLMFYKFVGENYIVWLIPFSGILAVNGSRIRKFHLSLSFVALVSSITDSLLPYYMLPVSPWIGGFLVYVLNLVSPERVAPGGASLPGITFGKLFLSSLGIISFAILLLKLWNTFTMVRKNKREEMEGLKGVPGLQT